MSGATVTMPGAPEQGSLSGEGAASLTDLLAAGERATFHGPPAQAVGALEQAIALAGQEGRRAEVTAAAWLLGVALAARGRYGGALTVLSPLIEPGEAADAAPEQELFAAFAAATIASVHRQLGRHSVARDYDERGLALVDDDEAGFDCRLGLAADAVGLGEVETAQEHLELAAEMVAAHKDWWRQQVRLDWVRAEVSLLEGDADAAVSAAVSAVERAEAALAPRHVAKGLLFLGVAQVQTGDEEAVTTLRRAATLAESLEALPLVWPARAVLGALVGDTDPVESARSLAAARSAVLGIAGDLPPGVRDSWLARSDVAALFEA
jgi:tetratricopeptide (TPR) repeat protein